MNRVIATLGWIDSQRSEFCKTSGTKCKTGARRKALNGLVGAGAGLETMTAGLETRLEKRKVGVAGIAGKCARIVTA